MTEASLQFHIKENDCFGTLATVLDLVSQDLRKKGDRSNAETLGRLRDRLMYLQQGYRIERNPAAVLGGGGDERDDIAEESSIVFVASTTHVAQKNARPWNGIIAD